MGIFPGLVALLLVPLGEANIRRSAVLHGAVSMAYSPSQKMGTIQLITWRFNKNGERVTILDTSEKPYYIYDSRFRGRLMKPNDLFTLTIMDLTMEDTGIYTIDVADRNGNTESSSFNVTVYEPVPHPSIRTELKEKTTDRCDVTLHCSVPSYTSDFSYTWKHRLRISEYRLYNNRSSIQMSLKNDSWDMEILCIVQNPADQKNVSIQVQDICKIAGESGTRHHLIIIIPILIAIVILAIISVIIIWKKYTRKKEPRENKNPETHYIEVITHQPEGNERVQMENEEYIGMPSPQRTKAETLYSTVQLPQPKYKR